ncbi:rCG64105 [Rattus norvegicus]|uniref:RCG64105 n=1 Tax=Rattus norvegicus TaxID=10116 RepID=A6JW76_RAT|nr:rCG64105 [Rattus norvegicus]
MWSCWISTLEMSVSWTLSLILRRHILSLTSL